MMDLLAGSFSLYASSAAIGVLIIYFLYKFGTKNHNIWKEKNIPYVKPLPFFGNLLTITQNRVEDLDCERHKKYGRVYGYFDGTKPGLMIAEPEIIKDICVKDFQSFTDRAHFETGEDVVAKMLIIINGDDWKRLRMVMSPTFSTGKLKRVLSIFEDCSKSLVKSFEKFAVSNKPVDVYKMYSSFTVDIIASSAFSTKIDSHNDPNNPFVKHVKGIFDTEFGIRQLLFFVIPSIMRFLRFELFSSQSVKFFCDSIVEIIKTRKRTGQTRNDFLQLLLECADEVSKEELENASEDISHNYVSESTDRTVFKNVSKKSLTMDELVAQCVLFFVAGYQTTTLMLGYTTYNLALNQDIQEKLFNEIKEVLEESKGKLTYEAIQNMKYLDNVMSEALRLHPPVVRLDREAVVDYEFKSLGITIPKGTTVNAPVYAMHRDPEFFPDPEKFDPDRFSPENKDKIAPYSYLPFGAGPRNCIGMRFALLESKICLAHVLSKFIVETCPETKIPIEHDIGGLGFLRPREITLRLIQRDDCPLK